MTAYNPPEFQFSGLIFNPLIYEQGEASTSSGSSGTFVDLTTDNLYTNNIQGKTPSATTSLYTLSSGIVSLGGSILTALYYITNVHYFYNALKDQLVSMRFNLYATDMISTDYYADIAGTALSVSVRASPQFTGDTTFANGVYTILAGTTRLLNLIKTSLEAPIHWLYNTAQTQGKSTGFGATTITETYYCDTGTPTIPTATMEVKDFGFSGSNNGNVTLTNGQFAVNSVSSIVLTSPANGLLGDVTSIALSSGGTLGRTYRYATNNLIERVKADTSQPLIDSGRIDWTPSPTTPAVANTGVYKLTAGEFQTTAPITPMYSYNATNGAGTDVNIGYIYRTAAATNTFLMNADTFYNFQNLTLVDIGVYIISVKVELYNANTSGTILVYYFDLCVGTTALGGIQLQEYWCMNYITLNNTLSPNFNADAFITFPYVNTTANQIIYTSGKIGRAAAGIRYTGAGSFIRAVRIA